MNDPHENSIKPGDGMPTKCKPYRGKPCTCDNCLGSSMPCYVDSGGKLGELWYCQKRATAGKPGSPE